MICIFPAKNNRAALVVEAVFSIFEHIQQSKNIDKSEILDFPLLKVKTTT
jgi:hypothetical protein